MRVQDLFSLKGKVALVTGGGRGIGKFIATGLAEAGADVIISSRKLGNLEKTAAEIEKLCSVRALAVGCDLAKEEDIDRLVKTSLEQFSRIDILVIGADDLGAGILVLVQIDGIREPAGRGAHRSRFHSGTRAGQDCQTRGTSH